jgi:hypothetical protein
MNIFQLLHLEHEQIRKNLTRIQFAENQETKLKLFRELKKDLTHHFEIENNLVYPVISEKINTPELFRKIKEIEQEIKMFYFELDQVDEDESRWENEINILAKYISYYTCYEENLFKIAAATINRVTLDKIYKEVISRKEMSAPQVSYFKHNISV